MIRHTRLSCFLLMTSALAITAVQAQDSLEERLSRVEQKLKEAEGDQAPWDKYVSEFGGRVQFDETFNIDADEELEQVIRDGDSLEDGAEFRRVRLFVEGPIASWLDYKLQLDFAGGVELKDVYFKVHDVGPSWPEIKIGNFKEPTVMDELTSSKYITFMARSMLSDFFSPEFNTGIQLSHHFADDRFNVWAGFFNSDFDEEDGESQTGTDGKYNFTARITSPVYYANEGRQLVHVGGSYHRRKTDGQLEFGLEPEVHKTDDFIGGTILGVEDSDTFNLELAAVFGSFHLQGEYANMSVNRDQGEEPDLEGYYLQGGYFLTGEHRPYDKGDGTFERLKPRSPFTGFGSGPGAWEIAARYSRLDFTEAGDLPESAFEPAFGSAAQATGELDVITVALNWYPVSHARWMLNYVHADQEELGEADYITTRFQVDF